MIAVEKICGAAAEAGADLPTLAALGRRVVGQAAHAQPRSERGSHPGAAEPAFELPDDLVEFGVGIHGERGTGRIPFGTADELVDQLVDRSSPSSG